MGKLFCVIGKSASGKDSIYNRLKEDPELGLKELILYTTRPIRDGEIDGVTYHFVDEAGYQAIAASGKMIEVRTYDTVYGPWRYFTVDDESIDLEHHNYIAIETLESYVKIMAYYGEEKIVPIYIEVEDGDRLLRAIGREKMQEVPKYEEMCRRFLADSKDFSEEKIRKAHIEKRFYNDDMASCIARIKEEVLRYIK